MLSVQTNLGGNTALKNLNTNTLNMNSAMNKLSSGFRINSAADDAVGFAVSSKLDGQAMRLKAASLNATQAQSMVKMADAGVNEIQNMVNRIQTLAVQASSANNAGELGKLDAERIKLESAINKIANGTNFNGVNLLNSSAGIAVAGTAATAGAFVASNKVTFTGTAAFSDVNKFTVTTDAAGKLASITSSVDLHSTVDGSVIARAGSNLLSAADIATPALVTTTAIDGLTFTSTNTAAVTVTNAAGTGGTLGSRSATFQVGAENTVDNQVSLTLSNSYTTASLGLGGGNLTTQANAQAYVNSAKTALNAVITQRADLGATQNQLGFIQSNLATSIEQTVASVSAIRDTDMAAQMANFTKNKILSQVGTSMLAQANQAAQNVMSLFR